MLSGIPGNNPGQTTHVFLDQDFGKIRVEGRRLGGDGVLLDAGRHLELVAQVALGAFGTRNSHHDADDRHRKKNDQHEGQSQSRTNGFKPMTVRPLAPLQGCLLRILSTGTQGP